MTNKQAIEILKHDCYVFNPLDFDNTTRINRALDVAVKALEREVVVENATSDCISREQTKAEIRKAFPQLKDRVEINSILNGLPSVKPKTGHWEYIQYDGNCGNWHCSECRTIISQIYKYCPNCGARMEVIKDEANDT